jgi:hypothetical protein
LTFELLKKCIKIQCSEKDEKKFVSSFGAITLFFEPACSRGLDYEYNYIA